MIIFLWRWLVMDKTEHIYRYIHTHIQVLRENGPKRWVYVKITSNINLMRRPEVKVLNERLNLVIADWDASVTCMLSDMIDKLLKLDSYKVEIWLNSHYTFAYLRCCSAFLKENFLHKSLSRMSFLRYQFRLSTYSPECCHALGRFFVEDIMTVGCLGGR